MKNFDYKVWLIIGFVILYSLFVFNVNYTFEHFAQIIGATVFFFALFAGFFITRQSGRYTNVADVIAEADGLFSYLYRVTGTIPKIQKEIQGIIRGHYQKILDSGNWAYHVLNPSTTITDLTVALEKLNEKENEEIAKSPVISHAGKVIWGVLLSLQLNRKKMLNLYNQRLLYFQWFIVYLLGLMLIVSFNFIPSPDDFYVDVLKIIFGTAVFMVIILLKQLNDLSLFGKKFSQKIANDVIRILDEKDKEELNK